MRVVAKYEMTAINEWIVFYSILVPSSRKVYYTHWLPPRNDSDDKIQPSHSETMNWGALRKSPLLWSSVLFMRYSSGMQRMQQRSIVWRNVELPVRDNSHSFHTVWGISQRITESELFAGLHVGVVTDAFCAELPSVVVAGPTVTTDGDELSVSPDPWLSTFMNDTSRSREKTRNTSWNKPKSYLLFVAAADWRHIISVQISSGWNCRPGAINWAGYNFDVSSLIINAAHFVAPAFNPRFEPKICKVLLQDEGRDRVGRSRVDIII